jgi:excinuclease UvrABC nuclease subunit
MTLPRKAAANRKNSRASCGPRTAAGKRNASRNALRHGLAAITHRQPPPAADVERFAKLICGDENDAELFAAATKIVENEMVIRAINQERVAVIERLSDRTAIALAKGDNSLAVARERSQQGKLAYERLQSLLPQVLENYKDELPSPIIFDEKLGPVCDDNLVPLHVKVRVKTSASLEDESRALEEARDEIRKQDRDEYEALEAAVPDLARLDRYHQRAWSRQKRAMSDFTRLKARLSSGQLQHNRGLEP